MTTDGAVGVFALAHNMYLKMRPFLWTIPQAATWSKSKNQGSGLSLLEVCKSLPCLVASSISEVASTSHLLPSQAICDALAFRAGRHFSKACNSTQEQRRRAPRKIDVPVQNLSLRVCMCARFTPESACAANTLSTFRLRARSSWTQSMIFACRARRTPRGGRVHNLFPLILNTPTRFVLLSGGISYDPNIRRGI